MMEEIQTLALSRDDAPVVLSTNKLELRLVEAAGMSIAFYQMYKGLDATSLLKDLPDDLCPCPHWGYFVKGRARVSTTSGEKVIEAGQAYYIPPGHIQEVLEDAEFVHFSPLEESRRVVEHMKERAKASKVEETTR